MNAATTTPNTPPMRKVYVCPCGHTAPCLPGFHAPGGPAVYIGGDAYYGAGFAGRLCAERNSTACYACPNCEQWARPYRTATQVRWDCLHQCALRGFATFPEVTL
jgi:hypothetical protein